jgi:hypothetical protein
MHRMAECRVAFACVDQGNQERGEELPPMGPFASVGNPVNAVTECGGAGASGPSHSARAAVQRQPSLRFAANLAVASIAFRVDLG